MNKGIKILDSNKDWHQDSMNMHSEMGLSQEMYEHFANESFVKCGSYTDNDELGKSHYDDSIGSIHNIFIDPTSESYIEALKREK